jgi:Transcription termination factor nusG
MKNAILAWICIHTRPAQEVPVRDRMLDLALDIFYPTRRITVPDRSRPGHSRSSVVPLYPRYLFADVDPSDYFQVPSVRGVSQIVHVHDDDDLPVFVTIPRHVIDALRSSQPPHLNVGQKIKLRGPYQGLLAIISSIAHLDSSGQVEVWLHMLGGRRLATLHHSLVLAEEPQVSI